MRIKQLRLNNIGPFAGEHIFDFQTENPKKKIVVIGGRNGAGKTTIFESVRLCLYGYKLYGYRQNSRIYTGKIRKLMNDQIKMSMPASADVSMQIFMEDGYADSVFDIRRQWILEGENIRENLSIYKDEKLLSEDEMQDFENYLMQTIPPALFNFHFFDGEKIADFVFDGANGQPFRKAFLQICGLDTIDLIEEQLQSDIRVSKKDLEDGVVSEYKEAEKELNSTKAECEQIDTKIHGLQEDIERARDKIADLDEAARKYGGVGDDEWKSFKQKIQQEENKRNELRQSLKTAANDVVPFIILKRQLEEPRQQLTEEEKIKQGRILRKKLSSPLLKEKLQQTLKDFPEIANEKILGKLISVLKDTLDEENSSNREEFLHISENDAVNLLAKIQYFDNYHIQSVIDAEQAIEESLKYTKELRTEMESKQIADTGQYLTRKNELLMYLDAANQQLLEGKEQQKQKEEELKSVQKEYHRTYEKYRAMLKERSVSDMSARALLAFGELKQKLYKKYIAAVEKSFFRNFSQLISKTDLLDGIYISSSFEVTAYKWTEIEAANILEQVQQYGEEYVCRNIGERAYQEIRDSGCTSGKISVPLKIEQHFSAGEKQIFVMALYQALAEIRTAELPFVIDTPLARIDSRHRENILSFFFSQLPGQVIILSTDEEIDGESLELLSDKISDLYLIEYQEDGTSSERKGTYFEEVGA